MNTEALIRDVDGDLFIGASRVLLENVIIAHRQGQSPEDMRDNYPSLSLAEIYGALVYYLEHQQALDTLLVENARALDELHAKNYAANHVFFDAVRERVEAARSQQGSETAPDEARRA